MRPKHILQKSLNMLSIYGNKLRTIWVQLQRCGRMEEKHVA